MDKPLEATSGFPLVLVICWISSSTLFLFFSIPELLILIGLPLIVLLIMAKQLAGVMAIVSRLLTC